MFGLRYQHHAVVLKYAKICLPKLSFITDAAYECFYVWP